MRRPINADGERQVSARQLDMVSKWWMGVRLSIEPASIENLRRIKRRDFFAKSSRFNLNANTCDLSTEGWESAFEIESGGTRRIAGVGTMFFLLRLTFWIGLVLVLLPRDKTPDTDKSPQIQINASEAVSAATAAISDMGQFCKRQPAACEVGGQAASVIGQRAQGGARKLYQMITDKPEKSEKSDKRVPDHTGSIGGMESADAAQPEVAHDTLTPDDMQIEWQGPSPPAP
jgi:hypothetical protein